MNKQIADLLGIDLNSPAKGIVIFYSANNREQTITEIGRTPELPFSQALDIYAKTPNPTSQLLQWSTEEEKEIILAQHAINIKDKKWLEYLFDMI